MWSKQIDVENKESFEQQQKVTLYGKVNLEMWFVLFGLYICLYALE
jgi:uncharacterized membrane protein YccF (DUF307 family)